MKLSTIINQAASGELQNIKTKDDNSKIVQHVNLALIALYNRFLLKTEEAIVTLTDGKTLYTLDGTDPDVTVKGQPVPIDNVANVISVFDESGEVPVNDETVEYSVYTPVYDQVQVPTAETGNYLSIIYRANPTLIEYEEGVTDVTSVDVRLPMVLLEPMLHYIGYRAHGAIDGNINAEHNTHLMRFKQSCNDIEAAGLLPTDSLSMENRRKGFIV